MLIKGTYCGNMVVSGAVALDGARVIPDYEKNICRDQEEDADTTER